MLWKRKYEARLDAEMRDHVERRTAEWVAQGMAPEEARRRALAEFGGVELAKEECRDVNAWRIVAPVGRDLRHAVRTLRKSPVFTLVAVLVLGFAIGANLTAFTWVDALFLRPLPVHHPEELLQIWSTNASGEQLKTFSKAIEVLRTEPSFSGTCAFEEVAQPAEIAGAMRTIVGEAMSWDCFQALGLRTQLGRVYTQAEDFRSEDRVIVLSDALWRAGFSADREILGRQIRYGGAMYTVIGVMEPRFTGLNPGSSIGLIVPVSQVPQFPEPAIRGAFNIWAYFLVRRAPGVTLEQVRARLTVVGPRMLDDGAPPFYNAQQRRDYATRKIVAAPAGSATNGEWFSHRFTAPLYAFWGICGLVLGVACVSLATLLLARGVARRKEIVVRLALGASRLAISRLLVFEGALLVLVGAAAGAVLARIANQFVAAQASETFRLTFSAGPDVRAAMLLLGLVATVISMLSFVIAWQVRRFGHGGLSESGRGTTVSKTRSQKLLLGAQVALTLALVCIGGLLAASIRHLYQLDLGIHTHDLSFAQLRTDPAPGGSQPDSPYFAELRHRIETLPGVTGAAFSQVAPFWTRTRTEKMSLVEGTAPDIDALAIAVDDAALGLLGIPIVAGDGFRGFGAASSEPTAIVTRSLADRFGGDSMIGKHVRVANFPTMQRLRIVGISGNVQFGLANPEDREPPTVFVNFWEQSRRQTFSALLIKTGAGVSPAGNTVAAVVRSLGREYMGDFRTLDRAKDDALIENTALAFVSSGFGAFALVLAAAGLFGLLSYHVATRVPEIGLRMTLGAEPRDVRWLVVREILPVVGTGCAAGLALAFSVGRTLSGVVYGIGPHDPALLVASVLVLLATALLAAWVPAQRAARVDPVQALRRE
jgi:predicted permease